MDSSLERSMFVDRMWVQCENESCLKWRLLPREDARRVDCSEPWYCSMNTDLRYNNCSVSEEDFPEESQFYENGYKFVYSQLPPGSLVLVKLQNWPSWPGILCPDPFKGKYVTYDVDGNVERYHIEFLGDPHSRSWINATYIGYFSVLLKPEKCTSRKKWYKSALHEAFLLHEYSPEQRLQVCHLSKRGRSKADSKDTVVARKRMRVSKNKIEKKPTFRKGKREATLKCCVENACSDEALSKENLVVSETEALLKDLEKMLQQAQEPTATPTEAEEGKLSRCGLEVPMGSPSQSCSEEDCFVIDGMHLKAGECIENITNKFKEIDALMSEL